MACHHEHQSKTSRYFVLPTEVSTSPFKYISGMIKFNRLLGVKHIYLDLLMLKIIVLSFVNSSQIVSNLNKANGDGAIIHVSSAYIK